MVDFESVDLVPVGKSQLDDTLKIINAASDLKSEILALRKIHDAFVRLRTPDESHDVYNFVPSALLLIIKHVDVVSGYKQDSVCIQQLRRFLSGRLKEHGFIWIRKLSYHCGSN